MAGLVLGLPVLGFKGWQVLFLIEAVPAIVFGFIIVFWMADHPQKAKWLTEEEKQFLTEQFERVVAAKGAVKRYSVWQALSDREVLSSPSSTSCISPDSGDSITGCQPS